MESFPTSIDMFSTSTKALIDSDKNLSKFMQELHLGDESKETLKNFRAFSGKYVI
jgi:hypothetical protein